ncbi:DUF6777 domain-containing protein [Streptomyces sp. NPDC046215]|uniref:DUF6777 domain-containing protein n=1 Tax=Streptomyces sp. NPDC046215 TaxID=3155774 RepID=UPI0033F82C99
MSVPSARAVPEPGTPDARRARVRLRRLRLVALLTVSVLLGGAALAGCSSAQKKKAVELMLEAAGVIAANPFMKAPDTDLQGVNSATRGGGEQAADARGAFGGTRSTTQCDKAFLIKELARDAVKARAWSRDRGIDENRITAHIDSLTSVILLHDTLVKNHNYQGEGRSLAYLSVLQAGVAVLVDAYGRPAVKCNCGNPLRQPETQVDLQASTYKGTRWETFQKTEVTVIKAVPESKGPMKEIPLVDPFQSDKAFNRGVGTDGKQDSPAFTWEPPARSTPSATTGSRPSGPPSSPSTATDPPTASATETDGSAGPVPPTGGTKPASPPSTRPVPPPTTARPTTATVRPPATTKPPEATTKPPVATVRPPVATTRSSAPRTASPRSPGVRTAGPATRPAGPSPATEGKPSYAPPPTRARSAPPASSAVVKPVPPPVTAKPPPTAPKPVEPKPVPPKPVEPKPVPPKATVPKPVEPKPVEPKPVEPKPVAPKPVQPKPVDPEPAQPKPLPPTAAGPPPAPRPGTPG